jgi:hypothetical protein
MLPDVSVSLGSYSFLIWKYFNVLIHSGFTLTEENQACVSTYTTATTVNYWGIPNIDNDQGTQIVRPGATVGPGILWQRADALLQPSATSTSSAIITSQTETGESGIPISFYHSSGPSNATIIAISAILGLAILILLVLAQKFLKKCGARKTDSLIRSYPIFSTIGGIFMLPITVAIFAGVTTCILAARRDWQEDIIRRWDAPNAVLRVIQVLSLIIRLSATMFGWCFVTDIGWLIMSHGEKPSLILRTLDMTAVGGSYL